jgi:hypothetical protein
VLRFDVHDLVVEHPELHPDPMTVDANGPEVARQGPPVLDPPDPHAKGGGPPKDDVCGRELGSTGNIEHRPN